MTKSPVEAPPGGMKLSDIYYIIFRKKWLIAGFLGAGLIAALAAYFGQRPLYWSEAKLLVRYVVDTKSMETGTGAQTKSPDYNGEMIINSEKEILTSLDLCDEVASVIGPEKLLGNKGGSNITAAAAVVAGGLTVDNPPRSNIIRVRFAHSDPRICQVVLQQVIESYFKRHKAIHQDASAFDDVLSQKAQQLLTRIKQNQEELRNLKTKAGVVSVDDAKKDLTDQLSRRRAELFDAEAKLAEYQSLLGPISTPAKNEKDAVEVGASSEKVAEYKMIAGLLDSLRKKEFEMRSSGYKDAHPQMELVRQQIVENEKRKKILETESPKLTQLYIAQPSIAPTLGADRPDPARIAGLESRIKTITNQLAQVRRDIALFDNLESAILDVQRTLQLDQQDYMNVSAGLRAARFNEVLGGVKMSNIQPVQNPSPPAANVSQRLKRVAIAFVGFLMAGLAAAFFIELFVDHTVRRSSEFESKLQMPLFLSIPKLGLNGHAKLLPLPSHLLAPAAEHDAAGELKNTWVEHHPLRPYIDGLRDRTLIHFEGDPHKPKLIGITSCSEASGVTCLAAGLAGALSETGDGNVLLLNLNFESQSVHPFYRGELACGLTDVLETEKRRNNAVLHNLYVATANNSGDVESQNLSKQLARVVPKLRVSDYEYIIFDLPPTTPTTMTARLAGMMDLVILVVESEKDTQEAVKQAGKLLSRSKARVSAVLNKVRNPVPRWLHRGA